jgi:hypothetical protein
VWCDTVCGMEWNRMLFTSIRAERKADTGRSGQIVKKLSKRYSNYASRFIVTWNVIV